MNSESKEKIVRNKDNGTSLERYGKSFCHAIDGIIYASKYEHNVIIMFTATVLVVLAGILFHISINEWLFCILIIGAIFASEMINTSIEATIDLMSPKIHPLAKIAKDTASSASLILSFTAFLGALIIFIPKILLLFN